MIGLMTSSSVSGYDGTDRHRTGKSSVSTGSTTGWVGSTTGRVGPPGRGSVRLQRRRTTGRLYHLRRFQVREVERPVLRPPRLALGRQRVDRVVVLVGARERLGVGGLDGCAVVLGPVRDAVHLVVVRELVHPALAH